MGKTFSTGLLTNGLWQDASNNIGIGGSPSGSYKLEVTGTAKVSSTLLVSGAATFSSSVNIGASATTGKQLIVNQTGASGYFLSGEASGTEIAYWYYDASTIQFSSKSATRALTFLTNDTTRLTIASTGAATFSKSISANGGNSSDANNVFTGFTADLYAVAVRQKGASAGISGTQYMAQVISSLGAEGLEIYTPNAKDLILGTNATERMRITSGGDVGIGTSSIYYASTNRRVLEINGTSTSFLAFKTGDVAKSYLFQTGANFIITNLAAAGGYLALENNGAERLRINSDGSAIFANSIAGGAVYSLSGFVNQTLTITTAALVYSLDKDQGASGGSSSTTFNITGIPNQDGSFAIIRARSSNSGPFNVGITIQIHGNTVFTTSTQNVTKTATFMVFRQNGSWVASAVGTGGTAGYP